MEDKTFTFEELTKFGTLCFICGIANEIELTPDKIEKFRIAFVQDLLKWDESITAQYEKTLAISQEYVDDRMK